jgi:YCII-related domain
MYRFRLQRTDGSPADPPTYDIIRCASMDEAVEIAAGHPAAQNGTIEVRPLWAT